MIVVTVSSRYDPALFDSISERVYDRRVFASWIPEKISINGYKVETYAEARRVIAKCIKEFKSEGSDAEKEV